MCNCFETTLSGIEEQVKLKVPKNATEFSIDWRDRVFRFDGGLGIGLYVEWKYRNTKKDGTPFTNMKKSDAFIALTFCPFCGKKIEEAENAAS